MSAHRTITRIRLLLVVALLAGVAVVADGSAPASAATAPPRFDLAWGTQGPGPGELDTPVGIALSPTGQLYVVELGIHRIQEFIR